jgi:hypothetical protein
MKTKCGTEHFRLLFVSLKDLVTDYILLAKHLPANTKYHHVVLFVQANGFVPRLSQGADVSKGVLYDVASLTYLNVHSVHRQICC